MERKYRHTQSRRDPGIAMIASVLVFLLFPCLAFAERHLDVVSLDAAVRAALAANPDLLATRQEEVAARWAVKASRGLRFPSVDAYGSYSRFSDPVVVVPIKSFGGAPPVFSRDIYSAGIHGSVALFRGGTLRAQMKAASSFHGQQRQERLWEEQVLVARVTDTFNRILSLRASLDAERETLQALIKTRDDTSMREKLGRVPPLDLMEMDTQVADQRQKIVSTEESLRRAKQYLALLMGRDPQADYEVVGSLSPGRLGGMDLTEMMERAMHRSDVVGAEKEVERAHAELLQAKGARLPRIDLVADYGRRAGSGGESDEEVWSTGVNVTLNLFSGGTLEAKIAQARAKERAAQKRLEALRWQVKEEVLAAVSALSEAEARLSLAREAVRSAKEAYRIEGIRYREGAGTVTELLRAQAAWRRAEVFQVAARLDRIHALTALRLATGSILQATKTGG